MKKVLLITFFILLCIPSFAFLGGFNDRGIIKTKKNEIDNIEKLESRNFNVGDIVYIGGYATVGDGGDHKRIISDTDDGSGIELDNGLFANIVLENNVYNLAWEGVDNTADVDQSEKIQKVLDYFETNTKKGNVIIPTGDIYLENTIEINSQYISKFSGCEGGTRFTIKPTTNTFIGDSVIQVYSIPNVDTDATGSWENRKYRFMTVSDFIIEDLDQTKIINGIEYGGTGTLASQVETVTTKNIYVSYCNAAQYLNNHVYKLITEKCYSALNNYSVYQPSGITDAGEVPMWIGCWFVDGAGAMVLRKSSYFSGCSFHNAINLEQASTIFCDDGIYSFDQCHFERITSSSPTIFDSWFKSGGLSVTINVTNSEFIVTNTDYDYMKIKECVFDMSSGGLLNLKDNQMDYFITRLEWTETAAGELDTLVKLGDKGQLRTSGIKFYPEFITNNVGLLSDNSPIFTDYTFEYWDISDIDNAFTVSGMDGGTSVVTSKTTNALSEYGSGDEVYRLTFTATSQDFVFIGIKVKIPTGSTMVGFKFNGFISGVASRLQFDDETYYFYDHTGKVISTSSVLALNNNLALYKSDSSGSLKQTSGARCLRLIPDEADEVFVRVTARLENGSNIVDLDLFSVEFY